MVYHRFTILPIKMAIGTSPSDTTSSEAQGFTDEIQARLVQKLVYGIASWMVQIMEYLMGYHRMFSWITIGILIGYDSELHMIYHLVMTNSSPWKDPPFLSSVNHLFRKTMANC